MVTTFQRSLSRVTRNSWDDTRLCREDYGDPKIYVVQTSANDVISTLHPHGHRSRRPRSRPTCGSGTTAYVAEQWGRRWITIDTSRVALALARARIMGARYPYHLLADSREGQRKEAEVTRTAPSETPVHGNIRQGFVYERVPHITLKSIANNAEIDVIWEKFQATLEPLREQLNCTLGQEKTPWEEWEIPREADAGWSEEAKRLHAEWWEQRIARQKEIDASIAAKADYEYLYDKPYEDKKKVRVAGPFTVESLSPHRVLSVDEDDELIDGVAEPEAGYGEEHDFARMILENLKTAGVQQAHKEDKISFTAITPWPGDLICAEGRYLEGDQEAGTEKRAAIFIGPEFGTVSRPDLVQAAREAGDADFDALITCAFNYDARSSEFDKLGRIPVLQGPHERRPAHGRRSEEHRPGQFVRHLRRAGSLTTRQSIGPFSSTSWTLRTDRFGSRSTAWTYSIRTPVKSAATTPTASPAGLSTPTTTKRASSFATPISSEPTTPTKPSRPPSRPRSTQTPGRRSTATPPARSTNPRPGGLSRQGHQSSGRRGNEGVSGMTIPSPKQVFDDPTEHWAFLTQSSDDDFEGQYFDRKEAGRAGVDAKRLEKLVEQLGGTGSDQRDDFCI